MGVTLRELSKIVGISASFISQVEVGKTSPSLQSLKKIADALNTTVGNLMGENDKVTDTPEIKVKDRKTVKGIEKGVEIQFLSSLDKSHSMEPCIQKLEQNSVSGNPPYEHPGQEFVYVIKGHMEMILGEKKYLMEKGDCFYFDSNIGHSFKNVGMKVLEILCVSSPSYF